jgi:hypothetical protein
LVVPEDKGPSVNLGTLSCAGTHLASAQ